MDIVRGSGVSTCFMYGGPQESAAAVHARNDKIAAEQLSWQAVQLEKQLAQDEAEEVEWEADARYILLELWEVLNDAHNDDSDAQPKRDGSSIRAQYDNGVKAVKQLYQWCKAAIL